MSGKDPGKESKVPPIQTGILDELRRLAGPRAEDELRELGTVFLQETVLKLTTIATALDAGDFPKMQRAAQSLRASSGNIGATRFSALCHELAEITDSAHVENARAISRKLREEFVRVRAELDRILIKSKAA